MKPIYKLTNNAKDGLFYQDAIKDEEKIPEGWTDNLDDIPESDWDEE